MENNEEKIVPAELPPQPEKKKKKNRRVPITAIILSLLLFILAIIFVFIDIPLHMSGRGLPYKVAYLSDLPEKSDCVVVLGAGLKPDLTPGDFLLDRLNTGVYIYEKGYAEKILMSGAENEVASMKAYALESGIPEENIICDPLGLSTVESMYRAKYIYDMESVVVVTQSFHILRAIYDGNHAGMRTYGIAAVDIQVAEEHSDLLKHYKLREKFACMKDFTFIHLGYRP